MKSIEDDIITLSQLLLQKKLKLVTAESCTGGGLAYYLTSLTGSSNWFERGYVTYSNESKQELLGVPKDIIQTYGAVSKETAAKMAEGALKNSHADIAISITGIAGPDGGSKEKPVGTVWFGLAMKNQPTQTFHEIFSGNREDIRLSTLFQAFSIIITFVTTF